MLRTKQDNCEQSLLSDKTLLMHQDINAEQSLNTDASSIAVGGVLQNRKTQLTFFSKKLGDAEKKYLLLAESCWLLT